MRIQNLQRLSSFSLHCRIWWILFCPHCPVSSAGGLSCKHLSKGGSLSAPLFKGTQSQACGYSRGLLPHFSSHPPGPSPPRLHFLFLPLRHSPTRTDLLNRRRLRPRDAAGSVLASQGLPAGKQGPCWLVSVSGPCCHNGSLRPSHSCPCQAGKSKYLSGPSSPQQQWPGTEEKESLTRAHARPVGKTAAIRGQERSSRDTFKVQCVAFGSIYESYIGKSFNILPINTLI